MKIDDSDVLSNEIKDKFNNLTEIWPSNNGWSTYSKSTISRILNSFMMDRALHGKLILNAGSGDTDYDFGDNRVINLDMAYNKVSKLDIAAVGNIEFLPFYHCVFDLVVCVGSVLNYSNPITAVSEISRVLKPRGLLLLDFDSSKSHEFLFSKDYNKSVSLIKTFYNESDDILYVYSPGFIENLLLFNGILISQSTKYHFISPLVYRLTSNERIAAKFASADNIIKHIPLIRELSANVFLICQKRF